MSKMNEILAAMKKEEKQCCKLKTILAIIGVIVMIAGIAFAVYKFLTGRKNDEECCECGCCCGEECTCEKDNCIEIDLSEAEAAKEETTTAEA